MSKGNGECVARVIEALAHIHEAAEYMDRLYEVVGRLTADDDMMVSTARVDADRAMAEGSARLLRAYRILRDVCDDAVGQETVKRRSLRLLRQSEAIEADRVARQGPAATQVCVLGEGPPLSACRPRLVADTG